MDNGAFTAWTRGIQPNWKLYYAWVERWLDWHTTWTIIPDVIAGDAQDNDALIKQWPHGTRGAPVWHMHEHINRLLRLAEKWPRVCIGSSGAYREVGSDRWHGRMVEAMNALCGDGPPPVWLHMLRGMALSGSIYPFASVNSSDVARNHNRVPGSAGTRAACGMPSNARRAGLCATSNPPSPWCRTSRRSGAAGGSWRVRARSR